MLLHVDVLALCIGPTVRAAGLHTLILRGLKFVFNRLLPATADPGPAAIMAAFACDDFVSQGDAVT